MKKHIIVVGIASKLTLGVRGPEVEWIGNRVRPSIKFISGKNTVKINNSFRKEQ